MVKIIKNAPLFAGEDLLVNGIMRQPLIYYPPDKNPLEGLSDPNILTVMEEGKGAIAIPDPIPSDYPLPARDFVGIEIPGSSRPIEALTTANIMPQIMLEHELHDELKLDPKKDYMVVAVQDPNDAVAFRQGSASRYLLVVNKAAYKKMAIAALDDLANPHLGALLTHPERIESCRKVVVPESFTAIWDRRHTDKDGNAKTYCEEMKDPNSGVSKLIDQIIEQSGIPKVDLRQHALKREDYEMAGAILRAPPTGFTTHVLNARSSRGERTPPNN